KVPAVTSRTLAGSSWPDLLVKSSTGLISVVPTLGIRGFGAPVVSKGSWSGMNIIAGVGDVTGDGRSDVLARSAKTGRTRIYRGDGLGHVLLPGIAPTSAFAKVSQVIAARDFTRDGKADVLAVDRRTKALLLFRGLGSGTFAAPTVLKAGWTFPHTAVGNFNADALPDLMVTAADNRTVYLFPGAKRGKALGAAVKVATLPAAVSTLLGWGDLTGDGRSDLMVRNAATGLATIYAGTGTGKLGQAWGSFTSLAGLSRATLTPMVGSAQADIVARDSVGRLVVVPNNGLGNTGAALASNLKVPTATQVLGVGDWDGDGKSDVVVRTSAGNLLVLYPGLGNGKFGQPRSLGAGWKPVTRLAAVGDVTGDGHPDLMGRIGSGPMTIFPGNGTKAFKASVLAPAALRTSNQIGAGTWRPTGAALTSTDGSFVPLVGSTASDALRAANGSATSVYDTFVGVGDANGDGVADVLAREKGTGTIWLLPGKTAGGFAPRTWVASGFAGYQLIG
ncbi:MAG: FG-GAP repeat domain-containing protein, partial [Marmoricola sp.]